MEVHHHPQLHHKSKRLKEYLLECLMIFVAVSLGFIAENIRETIKEKEQVHQLSTSLVKDLTQDTVQLKLMIQANEKQIKQIDSLYRILQMPVAQMDNIRLQHFVAAANNATSFGTSDGTIKQLISTGSLRLFTKTEIPAQISIYQQLTSATTEAEKMRWNYTIKFLEGFISTHFTPENAAYMNRPEFIRDNAASFIPVDSKLRNFSQADATQLSVDLMLYKAYIHAVNAFYLSDLQIASGFIKQIKTEMHLGKE